MCTRFSADASTAAAVSAIGSGTSQSRGAQMARPAAGGAAGSAGPLSDFVGQRIYFRNGNMPCPVGSQPVNDEIDCIEGADETIDVQSICQSTGLSACLQRRNETLLPGGCFTIEYLGITSLVFNPAGEAATCTPPAFCDLICVKLPPSPATVTSTTFETTTSSLARTSSTTQTQTSTVTKTPTTITVTPTTTYTTATSTFSTSTSTTTMSTRTSTSTWSTLTITSTITSISTSTTSSSTSPELAGWNVSNFSFTSTTRFVPGQFVADDSDTIWESDDSEPFAESGSASSDSVSPVSESETESSETTSEPDRGNTTRSTTTSRFLRGAAPALADVNGVSS
eukprot:CAMPEP_0181429292 /NCGR_PEP_ID=MMETSP1110-20121109/17124_1 /TAXON_ID=174948 /ORGANISM="Symbiodinium sp., Strain CCMP421" /LENGTH=339 /DNA_ID=CAMNT_0023552555 /DNA_START=74 /DNA_END=1094 /DNA_ORIENTATION=+